MRIKTTTANFNDCNFTGNNATSEPGLGGAIYLESGTLNISGGTLSDCVAVNGGGIYTNGGTLSLSNFALSDCKAKVSGGGLYCKSSLDIKDNTTISDCYAMTSGGGVYSPTTTLQSGTVSGCYAPKGGGLYSTNNLTISYAGEAITNCHARDVSIADDDGATVTTSEAAVSGNEGGGIYKSGGTLSIATSGASVKGCSAYDGGGIYYNSNNTFTFSNGSVSGNTAANDGGGIYLKANTLNMSGSAVVSDNQATNNGGGVYKAGGTFTMSGGTIGGSTANANTAAKGAGVFVAAGQAMTMDNNNVASVISYNRASSAGGGIAAGDGAVLNFKEYVTVRNNTMGSGDSAVECNVYLDENSNTVINKTGALNANAYIGVYASDDQDDAHGKAGMPFGTHNNNTTNFDKFINDRRPFFYGVAGASNKQIVWSRFVCRITDSEGHLLYTDQAHTKPAAYVTLENGDKGTGGAFGALYNATPALYQQKRNSSGITSGT